MLPALANEAFTEVTIVFPRQSFVRRTWLNVRNFSRRIEALAALAVLSFPFAYFAIVLDIVDVPWRLAFAAAVSAGIVVIAIAVISVMLARTAPATLMSVVFRADELYMRNEDGKGYAAPWDWILSARESPAGIWIEVMALDGYRPGLKLANKPAMWLNRAQLTEEQFDWLRDRFADRGLLR